MKPDRRVTLSIPSQSAGRVSQRQLKEFLDEKAAQYNRPGFIESDPVSVPHRYSTKQDIEIAGLFASMLAWGKRGTIVTKCHDLLARMDDAPFDFIRHHSAQDLKNLTTFKHRTFNGTDTLYFIAFLKWYYTRHDSLEDAFALNASEQTTEHALIRFHDLFFSLEDHPPRTKKHIPTPVRKSACKRMNMYLRWMVRRDANGVDFGLWRKIPMAALICPCDLHVERVARKLGLVSRKQTDWTMAVELTEKLRKFDATDPVKYDFALFGLGIEEGWSKE